MSNIAKGKYQKWLTPEGLTLLEGWARRGLTDEQIAHNMGINKATLYRWKNDFCDICEALKKGKEVVDMEVENALFRSATGYEYTETEEIVSENGVKVKRVRKWMPPNVLAQIFWLKNRRPDLWRDNPQPKAESVDDGFIDALTHTAAEDWSGDE